MNNRIREWDGKIGPWWIYVIEHKGSGKIYIGQSKSFTRRFKEHALARTTSYISKAIRKYGWGSFRAFPIFDAKTQEEADALEVNSIAKYNTMVPNGYNLCGGGSNGGGGHRHPSVKKRISLSLSGRVFSKEHRANLSASVKKSFLLGRKHPSLGVVRSSDFIKNDRLSQKTRKMVKCFETGEIYESLRHAASETGINRESISFVASLKPDRDGYVRKKAGGYGWGFVNGRLSQNRELSHAEAV